MENQTDEKFTWVLHDFSFFNSERIYTAEFLIPGFKCRLVATHNGNIIACNMILTVSESLSLPSGWKTEHWFCEKVQDFGLTFMIPFSKHSAKDSEFLVNEELKIVVDIEVLEVGGKSEETSTVDVNGFQLLPSQVKSVKHLFEIYPEIASKLRIKNPLMKSAYMNLVLSLIETLRQSPQRITRGDIVDAYATLGFVTGAGFRLDWLEEKLDGVSAKKEKEEACETRMEKLEQELKEFKLKCSDIEALLEEEKAELSAFKAPSSDDDIF